MVKSDQGGVPPQRPDRRDEEAPRRVLRAAKPSATRIELGGPRGPVVIGGPFVLMAGPCAVETPAQIQTAARVVAECGGAILRGGAFKPRTSPYSFQGLGEQG